MISAEVLAFFKVEDEEDLEDAFEQLFFEHKQFFLNKVPVKKLVEARISKLEKAFALFAQSLDEVEAVKEPEVKFFSFDSLNLVDLFQDFQQAKAYFYLQFQQTNSVKTFVYVLRAYCEMYYAYAQKFQGEFEPDDSIRVSVENDSMMILSALKVYESNGGLTLNQLKNMENDPPEILVHEMKRLSLLFNSF